MASALTHGLAGRRACGHCRDSRLKCSRTLPWPAQEPPCERCVKRGVHCRPSSPTGIKTEEAAGNTYSNPEEDYSVIEFDEHDTDTDEHAKYINALEPVDDSVDAYDSTTSENSKSTNLLYPETEEEIVLMTGGASPSGSLATESKATIRKLKAQIGTSKPKAKSSDSRGRLAKLIPDNDDNSSEIEIVKWNFIPTDSMSGTKKRKRKSAASTEEQASSTPPPSGYITRSHTAKLKQESDAGLGHGYLVSKQSYTMAMPTPSKTPSTTSCKKRGRPKTKNGAAANATLELHQAISSGKYALAIKMVQEGADVTTTNVQGLTPLHLAVSGTMQNGSERDAAALVSLLVLHGADVNAPDAQGRTVLHMSIRSRDILKAVFGRKQSPNVNAQSHDGGDTPLHTAISLLPEYTQSGDNGWTLRLCERLISEGANVNAQNYSGKTPLLVLLEGLIDNLNNSALELEDRLPELLTHARKAALLTRLLIRNRADVTLEDEDTMSPVDLVKDQWRRWVRSSLFDEGMYTARSLIENQVGLDVLVEAERLALCAQNPQEGVAFAVGVLKNDLNTILKAIEQRNIHHG